MKTGIRELAAVIGISALGFVTFSGGAMAGNLERSKEFFDKLDSAHLDLVDQFYDKDAVFQDPVHQLRGAQAVKAYYAGLYQNVEAIRFEYGKSIESGDTVSLTWRMHLRAAAIDSKEITVDGVSLITFGGAQGKVISHRDYFDMGEFIYERIPVLRSLIGYIKRRLSKS